MVYRQSIRLCFGVFDVDRAPGAIILLTLFQLILSAVFGLAPAFNDFIDHLAVAMFVLPLRLALLTILTAGNQLLLLLQNGTIDSAQEHLVIPELYG